MKRISLVLIALLLVFLCSTAIANETVLITPTFTNMCVEKSTYTVSQLVSISYGRALLSTMLYMDFAMDQHSKASFDDVAFLDTSFFYEKDGMILVLFRGSNKLQGQNLMMMYAPSNKDGAYTLFNENDGTFAMLRAACDQNYGIGIENDITDMINVADRFGLRETTDSTAGKKDPSASLITGDLKWDVGDVFSDGLVKYRENGKWGYKNTSGDTVVWPRWDYAYNYQNGKAIVFDGALNEKGKPDSGSYAVIDLQGNIVFPMTTCYDIDLLEDEEDCVLVSYRNAKREWEYELWNKNGERISEERWSNCYDATEGLMAVKKDEKWGYVDIKTSKTVIDYLYDDVSPFSEGIACVAKTGLDHKLNHFYIDRNGNTVIDNQGWNYAAPFENGSDITTVFQGTTLYDGELPENGKYAILDRNGNLLTDYIWDEALPYENGTCIVARNTDKGLKWGLVNEKAEITAELLWDKVQYMSNGFAEVFVGKLDDRNNVESGKYGFIDAKGKQICDAQWDRVSEFHPDGYAVIGKKNADGIIQYGIIDSNGMIVIQPEYEDFPYKGYIFDLFSDSLAPVILNGKHGYVNIEGQMIIDATWSSAGRFADGRAIVEDDNCWYIIDTAGNIIYQYQSGMP